MINIFTFTNSTLMKSCNVTILITIQFKFISQIKLIHAIEISISTHFEIVISIHKITIFDRDYMFEFKKIINLSIYAYIINSNTITIFIENENDKLIHIFKNFCFVTINSRNESTRWRITENLLTKEERGKEEKNGGT